MRTSTRSSSAPRSQRLKAWWTRARRAVSAMSSMVDPCATRGLGDELYDPGELELDTYYYWRIDEVNDPCTWTGPVWRFKVANYIDLDDFERYDKGDNRIYYAWYDQRSQDYPEATGSWLGLATPPTYPVHMGQQ
ncbi:MAG: hypothetical protein ACYSUP_14260, partial [Planctomycetota bacterium]